MKKIFYTIVFLIVLFCYWRYFTSHHWKKEAETLLKTDHIELAVVTRYDYLPLHYNVDAYAVACKSQATSDFKKVEWQAIDEGWNHVPSKAYPTLSKDRVEYKATDLVEKMRHDYLVFEDKILVGLLEDRVIVSFDLCKEFKRWEVSALALKESSSNLESAQFSNVSADAKGNLHFQVQIENRKFQIQTQDFGKSWISSEIDFKP